jgi:hypothetical protein
MHHRSSAAHVDMAPAVVNGVSFRLAFPLLAARLPTRQVDRTDAAPRTRQNVENVFHALRTGWMTA